jgi:hypothetical protein
VDLLVREPGATMHELRRSLPILWDVSAMLHTEIRAAPRCAKGDIPGEMKWQFLVFVARSLRWIAAASSYDSQHEVHPARHVQTGARARMSR